ncbi:WD40 repeat-like protein [Coniochaeta hoffmannii]|uniref:WD40 repeat-like protein n=1 Tax=Coniochaeta hoffmannii TaxID=91930 RepID=A0AA38VN47_9PEZI|nr:WD40 repeat-like protein [Coniochaeta hoffmannii]
MPPSTASPGPAPRQSSTEVDRSRSQQVSLRWDDENSILRRPARLQFEVAECVETKTITTTTTTKRSYPPLFVREPRSLQSLDSKEYPLASRPTPPELTRVTLDMPDFDAEPWAFDEPPPTLQIDSAPRTDLAASLKREPGVDSPNSPSSPAYEPSTRTSLPPAESFTRRSTRTSTRMASPSYNASTRSSRRLNKNPGLSLHHAVSDKLRRAVATKSDKPRGFSSGYLATPDTTETANGVLDRTLRAMSPNVPTGADANATQSTYDAESPAASESHTLFSSNVATPPITDADLVPFDDSEVLMQPSVRQFPPRPTVNTVAAQDASLPSPRLSPTLAAAQVHPGLGQDAAADDDDVSIFSRHLARRDRRERRHWFDESQTTDEGDSAFPTTLSDGPPAQDDTWPVQPSFANTRSMLESFDAMPNDLKSFMMYQFLRRCPRKTLRMVAAVVNPAIKVDFLKQLPLELSLHILSYLDHRDLCRAAQVSKHWRNIVDSNETGWKELFDRDGFRLPPGELRTAIQQGWGWQDPVGEEGCEVDLSQQGRLTAPDADLVRQTRLATPASRPRSTKRKRSSLAPSVTSERVKRRASAQEPPKDEHSSQLEVRQHRSEGPISAANEAAVAVPDPHIGLPSLRKLHLFKSLYRRHYMIKQSWTSGKVKPSHVAFAAHPRHVITCLQFDDDKIITGSDDTLIHIYDTKTGKLRKKLEGHEGGVWALQYEGNTLVSGSTDRSVRVWDIEKGLCTQVFYGHTSTVRCLQILMPTETGRIENGRKIMMPPKPLIITGSRDSQLRVWRLPEATSRRYIQTGPPANDAECPFFIRILTGHAHSVRAISAHGDTLVSGSYDSTVRVWRISTGEQLHVLHGHSAKVYSVVLDHKRNRCISGSMDSLVKIWDLDTGACLYTLEGHSLLVGLLDLRDDRLVSAAADSTLRIWDPENGKCKNTLMAHTGAITCFQHDGQKVISGSEKTVKMWDIQSGDCIQDLLTNLSGVWQVKFDQRRCVAAVQRDNLTFIEILDFGAIRDGVPPEELGKRRLLNEAEVQRLLAEEL